MNRCESAPRGLFLTQMIRNGFALLLLMFFLFFYTRVSHREAALPWLGFLFNGACVCNPVTEQWEGRKKMCFYVCARVFHLWRAAFPK